MRTYWHCCASADPAQGRPAEEELYAPIEWRAAARVRGHPLRTGRGDRQDHDQPARGPQRLPPADAGRASRRLHPRPRRHSRSARSSSPAPASEAFCSGGDQRIRGDDGYIGDDEVAQQGVGRLDVGDLHVQIRRLPEAGARDGRRLRGRRRPDPAPRLRPLDRRRQRRLRPDRARGSAASTAASAPACWPATSASSKAKEIWFLCRLYDAEEALRDGARQRGRAARRARARVRSPGAARCPPSPRSRCAC